MAKRRRSLRNWLETSPPEEDMIMGDCPLPEPWEKKAPRISDQFHLLRVKRQPEGFDYDAAVHLEENNRYKDSLRKELRLGRITQAEFDRFRDI